MRPPRSVTGLILAGGGSARFGTDKALALLDGKPLIAHVHDALAPLVVEVLVSTGPTPRHYPIPAREVLDRPPEAGPLAGLAAGLRAIATHWTLVLACDLPFVTTDHLAMLLAARASGVEAVVATGPEGRRQPVCAVYHHSARAHAERQLAAGRFALHALIDGLVVREVALPAEALRNINAPSDLPD